jgi:REP element-mobilizing transposase RayT
MKYDPLIHKRRSIRLQGYDYSQAGLYFITICVQNRKMLFGKIENDEMILNDAGKMIQTEWGKLPERFPNIQLHEFVVMPNHFHGIIEIVGVALAPVVTDVGDPDAVVKHVVNEPGGVDGAGVRDNAGMQGATTRVAPTENMDETNCDMMTNKTVGEMMAAFKSITTVEYINGVKNLGWLPFNGKLWQRNFYENIIRNELAYINIADYIMSNPARWKDDKFYIHD